MDLKYSYYIIALLYGIIFAVKLLNKYEHKVFKKNHDTAQAYKIYKKDFFYTVAVSCVVVTIVINLLAFIGGQALITQAMVITVFIVGMAFLTGSNEMIVVEDKMLIEGMLVECNQIKEVKTKNRKNNLSYELVFDRPIDGYPSVKFVVNDTKKDAFDAYINTKHEV